MFPLGKAAAAEIEFRNVSLLDPKFEQAHEFNEDSSLQ